LHLNPTVTIEDWPEPTELETSDAEDEPIGELPLDGPDRDPEYTERTTPPGLDPNDESEFTDNELFALLQMHLGDIADEEWMDIRELRNHSYSPQMTFSDSNS
jgi:hypothetical protein